MQNILIVLPAYNEEESIADLLININDIANIYHLPLSVLIVNDGSNDQTVELARAVKLTIALHIIDNQINEGLGKVLREGLAYASNNLNDSDIVITMGSDNSHLPGLIPAMVNQINKGSDIVIASIYRQGSRVYGLSYFRKMTSFIAGSLFLIFAPIKGVRDYTCGYRAYRANILKNGFSLFREKFIEESGFSCMVEILLKLNSMKPIIHEVPMILRYDQKKGNSKMKIWPTIKKTLLVLSSYRLSRRFK
ncbi:MAG: glycosyltransferase family 2 protein [Saprospiraceae bacterium]